MKYLFKVNLIGCLIILFSACNHSSPNYLTGKVTDPQIQSLLLLGINQDMRFDSIIEIPVKNGKFHYQFEFDQPMAFDLMLGSAKENGGGRFMPLFLQDSDVELTVHPEEDFKKNKVQGGKLNEEYKSFQNYIDSISSKKHDFKFEDELALGDSHIRINSSIVSYYLFLSNLIYFPEFVDLRKAKVYYKDLSESNKMHPYNELAKNLLEAMENVKIGNEYIDFSAPDMNGDEFKLSTEIEGKVALLNLWATWCGPCIKKSREVVPIYEKYKDQDFALINVAGEFRDTQRLEKFFENEKWPGINLVELDRQNNIWQKYGVDGAGGGMFLIDQTGKLIAINPSSEEINIELEKRLIK
ncbi:TlpA disulfide reductase family protein [Salinimicrobium xinjiangense]|uniref:TlpA disulfide reductase family protein n=1 Tax=Salinimicrobium xinjiangense TaxID=438596 RepID=UPI0004080222|nr:TlpA disulfide reductase family protein [Salinimicrobium xinjiangense]